MERAKKVKELLRSQNLSREGREHLYGTAELCAQLARSRGENEELAFIAGLLHDIVFYLSGSPVNHARRSAAWAEQQLRQMGCFTEAEIRAVHGAIYLHSHKDMVHGPLAELLKEADTAQKHSKT